MKRSFTDQCLAVKTGDPARPRAAEAHPDFAIGGDPDIIRIVTDRETDRSAAKSASVEPMQLAVVAGRDIDKMASDTDSLRAAKPRDRSGPCPGFEVNHFQRAIRHAGHEQPAGQGIVSHVIDSAGDSRPISGPTNPLERKGSHELQTRTIILRSLGCESLLKTGTELRSANGQKNENTTHRSTSRREIRMNRRLSTSPPLARLFDGLLDGSLVVEVLILSRRDQSNPDDHVALACLAN